MGQRSVWTRREFLKRTAAGGALLAAGPYIWTPGAATAAGYAGGSASHPNISGLRVVGLIDDKMTSEVKPRATWLQQEPLVKADVVAANIDRLACTLAEEKDPKAAWLKVFVKPPGKAWKDVVVAVKTNHIAKQRSRSAVVAKVGHVLTDVLGVKGENVFIYDAVTGGQMSKQNRFAGLPEGVHLADKWGGINVAAPVPAPWKDGKEQARCLDHLVNEKVDILVNIALCKGHDDEFGKFTLTMKNHFGTFEPGPSHRPGGAADYLLAINKTPQILGPMDEKGKVTFPRQQLCLVDALWGSEQGPHVESSAQPNALFMGVFSPVLDYVVATRFRRDRLRWPLVEDVAARYLTDFGLAEKDLPNGGRIIEPTT